MIFLDANENPFDTGVNRYPDPHQRALKEKISVLRGVGTEQILIGNGSEPGDFFIQQRNGNPQPHGKAAPVSKQAHAHDPPGAHLLALPA